MHGPLKSIDDLMMRKLVALMQELLPDATHRGRSRLLAQLHVLEQEAVNCRANPATLRSIHATQGFVGRCDRLIDAS
jgi:hypothetical protein